MTTVLKLTTNGFKSFATKTELDFGNNFNCILGPNGSGKSNVMDALCFVLGKSSAKGLRAEKSANLIYNGGKTGRAAKESEVSIWFSNDNNDFPIDSKEVKISRILKKKGNSIYKINDKTHTRQQIVDLLRSANIDPDGHSIVLQGDIVRFMEMRPVDRRELIEEVAGISIFEDKKKKAMGELERVQERLNQINIILTERETNLRELRKDRDQAKKFLDVKKKFKDSKATFLHIKIKQKESKREDIDKSIAKYDSQLEKIRDKIGELKEGIESKNNEIKKINEVLDEKGEQEQKVLRVEISDLNSDIVRYNSRTETIKNELIKIEEKVKQIKSESASYGNEIVGLRKKKDGFLKQVGETSEIEEKLNVEISEFKKKYGLSEIGEFGNKLEEIDSEIEKKRDLLNFAIEEKQELSKEGNIIEFQIKKLNEDVAKLSGSKEKARIKQIKGDMSKCIKQLSKLRSSVEVFEGQLERNSSKLLETNENLARLKAKHAGAQEKVLSDFAVKRILEDKGRGIYGTVSELGEVDDQYSLALEVAAGMRTKSVVVDSDSTAAKYIRLLKSEKLGIATFLPLNKIKARAKNPGVNKILNKKGVYGLAIDLINFQPQFKKVFSYVFGSTVVVEKIETARKVGIGSARMVTLNGDLLEPSGAMVGGHRRKSALGFSQKKIDTKLQKLEESRNHLDKLITSVYSQKSELEEEIAKVNVEKSELEGDLIKLEKSLGIGSNVNDFESEIKNLNTRKSEIDKEIIEINSDLSKFEKEIENLQKSKIKVREGMSKKESSGIDKLEEKYNAAFKKRVQIESEVKTIDGKIQMIDSEKGKFDSIVESSIKDKAEFIEENKNIEKVVREKKITLKKKEKLEEEFYGKNRTLSAKRNNLTEMIQNMQQKIDRNSSEVGVVQMKKNNISINRAKIVSEIEAHNEEYKEFKDGIIKRGMDLAKLQEEIRSYDRIMRNAGNVNMRALEVYDHIKEEYDKMLDKVNILKSEREDVLEMIGEIDQKKTVEFMKTFDDLNEKFQTTFGYLYSKGEASIVLEDINEPLNGGATISVKTGKGKYLDIRSLSGGEKTLAALSFIFAIQEHNPASFYLMDEVDAALDKHNSEKLSKIFSKYANHAQYIVISHNDAIISEADQIYGVTMNKDKGVSKVVSLKI